MTYGVSQIKHGAHTVAGRIKYRHQRSNYLHLPRRDIEIEKIGFGGQSRRCMRWTSLMVVPEDRSHNLPQGATKPQDIRWADFFSRRFWRVVLSLSRRFSLVMTKTVAYGISGRGRHRRWARPGTIFSSPRVDGYWSRWWNEFRSGA